MPRAWIVVGAFALLALGWNLGGYPLLEPDEGRNAQVAREMVRGGDWVLPHLNGLPYLDKPAPYFAAVALGLEVFGGSEGGARAASLTFVLATVLIVWRLGRRMGPVGTGEIAAVALATMPLPLAYGRTVIPDPALLFLETATLAAAWRGFEDEPRAVRWFALSWALVGVGTITKGPVAIIVPVLILVAWGFAAGLRLRRYFALRAWPWALVTGLPWFIAVALRRPDFPRYAIVYESLERVATTTHGRAGPIWFFVPVLLGGSFPWIVPAAAGLAEAVRCRAARRSKEGRAAVLAIAWALMPLVFFSFSQSKLAGYYLPALPGVALGAGLFFAYALRDEAIRASAARSSRIAAGAMLALGAVMAVGIPFVGAIPRLATSVRQAIPGFALVFAGVLAVAAALAAWGAQRRSVWVGAAALALPVAAMPFVGSSLMDAIGRDRSSFDLAAAIERAAPGARVVGVAAYPTSLRYYLDRPMLMTTATGQEMTSHYVASRVAEFRDLPGSPLRPAGWWRTELDACEEPTVFVVRNAAPEAATLAAQLPRIASGGAGGRFVAYGPCGARPPEGAPVMCGITGVVSRTGAPLRFPDALPKMRETLEHRGPDGAGSVDFAAASLQIRRLAIIDLACGNQPFTSPDGRVSVVCNGEIYNSEDLRKDPAAQGYRFRSRSDVESVLPLYLAYGDACVRMLEGMFGLAIWDDRTRRLLLARDRSGEKPLFYADLGSELVFASEPKAILAYPAVDRTLDPVAATTFFALGYVLSPRTMRRGIRNLPPGHVLAADASGVRVSPYWRADDFAARSGASATDRREAAGAVRAVVRQAVARELMADVPVGVFLSGGLDSSILTALAAERFDHGGIFTYTVSFGDPSYDESGPAALVASRFRTAHRTVACDPDNLRRALDIMRDRLDEPLGDPAILPTYLLAEAARRDVKVILSGEGADELFGGYPTYFGHRAASAFAGLPASVRRAITRAVLAWPPSPRKVTIEFLLKGFVSNALLPPLARHVEWFGALGAAALDGLLGPAAAPGLAEARAELDAKGAMALAQRDVLDGVLLLDFLTYLPDDLLMKVDRATMLASVEARAPFLDRQVMELALSLPGALKVSGFTMKAVLKEAARPLLPGTILRRKKRGLSVPIASWINGSLRGEVDRVLESQRLEAEGWIRPDGVRRLLDEHRRGAANHARRLWPVIMFQRWLERWGS